ncbi:MAG: hypothetical protein KGJ68_11420 [Gammaproteobacteria bacterium]|nr:hypothetical protein [Gammaproteobacteria bacterium]
MSEDVHDDDMDDTPLARQLRAALRPEDPPQGFVAGVMARVAAEPAAPPRPRRSPAVLSWAAFGLAASVVLSVLLAHQWQVRRIEQGREARRQLLEALRVTDEKLDLTYRVVNAQPRAALPSHSGA